MKLNKNSLIKFRQLLEKELSFVGEGERIQLERETLEDLLFEKKIDEKAKKGYKVLVWSGLFLQHIDLSSISFDNVDWSDKAVKCLENTNANINFDNGYYSSETMTNGVKVIRNCRFDGTDLANSNISIVNTINSCSLKNTRANLVDFFEQKKNMNSVELNGVDLSGVSTSIDLVDYPDVCFTNTKAALKFDPNDSRLQYDHSRTYFGKNFAKDFYAGCYINGKQIRTREQERNMATIRYSGYEAWENSTINSTLSLVRRYKKGLN